MNLTYIILAIITVGIVFWLVERFRLRKYASRPCQGKAWKDAFPTSKNEEIRGFLTAFVDAFALPNSLKLRLTPKDKPIEIYNIITNGIDSFEFETFSMDLEEIFGRGLDEDTDDSWTLGDIFRHINQQAEPVAAGQRR